MNAGPDEQDASMLALRFLAEKAPPPEVRQRIIQGASAGRSRKGGWTKAFTALALAAAATTATLLVLPAGETIVSTPEPVLGSIEAPAAGAIREMGRFAVGPHLVDVARGGSVRFEVTAAGAAELRVESGSATFEVEKLAAGESFRVRTGQLLVEVVGTKFEVAAEEGCSSVSVHEGRVRVEDPAGSRFLGAGESGRYCTSAALPGSSGGEALVREAVVLVSRGQELQRAAGLLERYQSDFGGGPFEEEALFYLTLARAQLGERIAADQLAERFRGRFPESPRVQRLEQLLGRVGQ